MGSVREEDASNLQLGPDFQEAECLAISETYILLENFALREDRTLGGDLPGAVRDAHDYVKRFNRFPSKMAVEGARRILEEARISDFELVALMNLMPRDLDEATSLVPTLKRMDAETLRGLLDEISLHATIQ